jgi:ribonucleotide reductase alpha subunit
MLLSNKFLDKYRGKANPFPTALGEFVYYRTYSRYKEAEGRREMWWETVRRAVEYNCSLVKGVKTKEAEQMFDNIYNLRQFPSGRTLWVGGEQVSLDVPTANFNCAMNIIDQLKAFYDTFYLLLVGSGVGIRILKDDVKKLPRFRTDFSVHMKPYEPVVKSERIQKTFVDGFNNTWYIVVGDSKNGWVDSLKALFEILTNETKAEHINIAVDFDNVRPKGELLKTFGGFASGHESLQEMFEKIATVIQTSTGELKPIDCLDIICMIGENVVAGGTRRTSIMAMIDEDDNECITAKNDLYDAEGELNKALSHRRTSNNSILYFKKPTMEQLKWQVEQMRYTGEPAFVNMVAGRKRKPNMEGVNPCLTGGMKLLTVDGYKTFEELVDTEPLIISKDGDVSKSKVWCSGTKEIYEIKRGNKTLITCTKDHRFMTIDKKEVEAQFLKGERLMPYIKPPVLEDVLMVKLGFIQGDGNLSRLKSETHKGLEVNFSHKDRDVKDLFGYKGVDRTYYTSEYNEVLKGLGFSSENLPLRQLPKPISRWEDSEQKAFLKGLYSANGSVLSNGRVTLKSTCLELITGVQELLTKFSIFSYITTNKSKLVKFSNGEYVCKESYDLNIQEYMSRLEFCNAIGFIQSYKTDRLTYTLIEQSPKVTSVKSLDKVEKVYDFTEPLTHWGVVEGFIAHNCGEILLKNRQMCNLTTVNVLAFVTEENTLDWDGLLEAQRLSVRMALRMASVKLELEGWDDASETVTGCSLTGWEDAMNRLDARYTQRSLIEDALNEVSKEEAGYYALEIGVTPPELVTTIKPEGTISLLPTVSSGMHFSHSPYYIRRVRINKDNPLSKAMRAMGFVVEDDVTNSNLDVISFPVLAPEGKTKYDISALEQLRLYRNIMKNYVDHNASNTIHVRKHEWEGVTDWLYENWDDVVAVSFLPLDDAVYKQMPFEAVTRAEYRDLVGRTPKFDPEVLRKLEEVHTEFDIGDNDECSTGICPIR